MTAPSPHARHGKATDEEDEVLVGPGGYAVTEKMRWRTPEWLYQVLDEEFHFDLDACSEDGCTLAPRWITVELDALTVDWRFTYRQRCSGEPQTLAFRPYDGGPVRTAFQNPPWAASYTPKWVREAYPDVEWESFPGTGAFLQKAWEMSRVGVTSANLLPQAFDAAWAKPLLQRAAEIRVGRRIRFIDVHGNVGPQPPGGHCLIVFRPEVPDDGLPGGPVVDWDWRPDLEYVKPFPNHGADGADKE